jgi:hypothetical protein
MPFALNLSYFFSKGNSGWYKGSKELLAISPTLYFLFVLNVAGRNERFFFREVE